MLSVLNVVGLFHFFYQKIGLYEFPVTVNAKRAFALPSAIEPISSICIIGK
jgi:hypothetical protein